MTEPTTKPCNHCKEKKSIHFFSAGEWRRKSGKCTACVSALNKGRDRYAARAPKDSQFNAMR